MNKKAQLFGIELKEWLIGFTIGIIIALVLVFLFARGFIVPKLDFICNILCPITKGV